MMYHPASFHIIYSRLTCAQLVQNLLFLSSPRLVSDVFCLSNHITNFEVPHPCLCDSFSALITSSLFHCRLETVCSTNHLHCSDCTPCHNSS